MQDSRHPDGARSDTVNDGVGELLEDAFPCVVDAGPKFQPQQGNPFEVAFDFKKTVPGYGFGCCFEIVADNCELIRRCPF